MSEQNNDYKPEPSVVEALAKPAIARTDDNGADSAVVIPEVEGHSPRIAEEQVITLNDENRKAAVDHIKDTLTTLKGLLDDLKELAPASQQGFLFQCAATLAKTRIEGANMLAALEGGPASKAKEETRGGSRSNHLHLNVTSAQFGDFIASQVKKAKNVK
jgi:hypothetical protein